MGKEGEFAKTQAERKKDQENLEVNLSNVFKTEEKVFGCNMLVGDEGSRTMV